MNKFGKSGALIIVDVQNDFCPGGALAVPDGDQVIPVLNQWIEAVVKAQAVIFATRDWHPPGTYQFQRAGRALAPTLCSAYAGGGTPWQAATTG